MMIWLSFDETIAEDDQFCYFLLKFNSWACFLGSGLNLIFHWKAQSLIFLKLLFRSYDAEFMFWTTENREVSSANTFVFGVKPPDKSLM